jgi:hypothetical protein
MGFLDHSTNNIIVDAVLTDIGREFLARNDGSFSIVKFALGDDEVDYTMIKKFGRTVGKEKIEKNTPVFEAQTNANLALKYRSISISNPNLVRVPTVQLTSTGLSTINTKLIIMSSTGANSTRDVTLKQTITGESLIDPELRDQAFIVKMSNQFLTLSGYAPDSVDKDGVATYLILRVAGSSADGGSSITLSLALKSITSTQFAIYGNSTDKTVISTVVSVTGMQSGAVKEFEVQINQ